VSVKKVCAFKLHEAYWQADERRGATDVFLVLHTLLKKHQNPKGLIYRS
jgi:hypothetical protein